MRPTKLLQQINQKHRTTFALIERYASGEQGALAQASLNVLSVYLAHLILRQADWSLRHHDKMTSDRYLSRGHALLQDIAYRSRYVS